MSQDVFKQGKNKGYLTTINKGVIMNSDKLKRMGIDTTKLVVVDLTNKSTCDTIKIKRSGFWSAMQKQKHYRLR